MGGEGKKSLLIRAGQELGKLKDPSEQVGTQSREASQQGSESRQKPAQSWTAVWVLGSQGSLGTFSPEVRTEAHLSLTGWCKQNYSTLRMALRHYHS